MATTTILAKRRAEALEAIESASNAIAQKYGIEITPLAKKQQDPDLERVMQLEAIAETLNLVAEAEAVKPKTKAKK